VKADAYGHGAPRVARALAEGGVDWFGVALVEEGAELRRAGVREPILVLGVGDRAQLPLFRKYRLTPTISSRSQLAIWSEWMSSTSAAQPIHLKVDTGMSRLGLAPEEVPWALASIRSHPSLQLEGFLSHLADADDLTSPNNPEQERAFAELLELLTPEERESALIHLANSAGSLHHPNCRHRMVRLGLSLYGYDPSGPTADLAPVMSVATRVVQARQIEAGTSVGYGSSWTAIRPSRIGVVPVGYADGYQRGLSNVAHGLAGGRRVPIVGTVSMDLTMLDLTDTSVEEGDEVVLLGSQGAEEITARELAGHLKTIPYELLCGLGLRLPRRYLKAGRFIAFESRFARTENLE